MFWLVFTLMWRSGNNLLLTAYWRKADLDVFNQAEWERGLSDEITKDKLWRMKAYRLSIFLGAIGWRDVTKLLEDRRTAGVADQLYRAIGSIGANIAEGYSRNSGKDRVRYYEYTLGSARESKHWYAHSEPILTKKVVNHRLNVASEIIKLLLIIVPLEREIVLKETAAEYEVLGELETIIPFAD